MAPDDSPYSGFSAERIEHMEMIQAVIARLGANGFLVKGWAVTVAAALLGLAVNQNDDGLAYVAVVPVAAFWALDGYLLRAERLFRALFDEVRKSDTAVEPFWMAATSSVFIAHARVADPDAGSGVRSILRPTLSLLYGCLLVAAVVVGILIG
jgi:hypothetical protein